MCVYVFNEQQKQLTSGGNIVRDNWPPFINPKLPVKYKISTRLTDLNTMEQ